MKAEITDAGIELIPQTKEDEVYLGIIYKDNTHLHFCCKAFYKPKNKFKRLLLTPSFTKFKKTKERKKNVRK